MSRLPFTATGWDTESETSRVQRHEWRASCAHPLLGRVWSSLVKLASWNYGSVEEYVFFGFTTLSNNHRRNEWWRERFVFLDVLRRKGFSHWKWTMNMWGKRFSWTEPLWVPFHHATVPLCHYVIDMLNRLCRLALLLVHILSSRYSRIHFKVCWCGWCQVRLTPWKLWAKKLILEIVSEKNRELKQTLEPQNPWKNGGLSPTKYGL